MLRPYLLFLHSAMFIVMLAGNWMCSPAPTAISQFVQQDTLKWICVFPKCLEQPAAYPGGMDAWKQYLQNNTSYPEAAYSKKIEGVARIEFTISEEGFVTNVAALNELKGGLTEEAIRVIKASPKWNPATLNGKPVKYRLVQLITFQWAPIEDDCNSKDSSTTPFS
jgi:TonB family protein